MKYAELFESKNVKTISSQVTNATVFDEDETTDNKVHVRLTFRDTFAGNHYDKKTKKFTPASDVNTIDFSRRRLTRNLSEVDEDIMMLRSMQREGFVQHEFALLLVASTLTFERIEVPVGTEIEYPDGHSVKVEGNNSWITRITGYKPSKRAKKAIDNALEF